MERVFWEISVSHSEKGNGEFVVLVFTKPQFSRIMEGMETRMERYAKYRDSIRRMTEEDFAEARLTPAERSRLSAAKSPEEAAQALLGSLPVPKNHETANRDYLKSKRRMAVLKLVIGLLLLVGFAIWGISLWMRMPK